MKAKPFASLLGLGLVLAASLAHAQNTPPPAATYSYTYSYGINVTQSDPALTASNTAVNITSQVGTGGTSAHSATLQFLAGVNCTPSSGPPPNTVDVPYELVNQADGDVTLGGMTPPTGTGYGYAAVENLLGNTGTVNRGTDNVTVQAHAGAAKQRKKPTISVPKWTDNMDGTFTAWVVLETSTLTTRAHIDSLPGTGTPPPGGPGDPNPGGSGTAAHPDSAVGYASQLIQAQTTGP